MWRELFFKNISTYIALINEYLSEEYKPKPLSEYFKIVGGYAFKSKEYQEEGIPVIRISDFQNEKIVLDNVRYYQESEDLEKYELFEGDIIIAMTGGTIGKLAIVEKGLGKLYLNQRVGKFELKDNSLFYDKYVYWIARGVEEKVKSLAWGGAQPNVSSKKIEGMEFPVPTVEIQEKIVAFLSDFEKNQIKNITYFNEFIENRIFEIQQQCVKISSLDSEIQTQKQLISQLKQAILQEAIQGKLTQEWREQNPNTEPASELLERIKAEKEQLIKDKKIKKEKPLPPITEDEIPFEIPESWVWCRLGDLCRKVTDGFHNTPPKIKEGYPYIAATHVKSDKIDWQNAYKVSEKFHRELYNKANPQKGEILVVNIGAGSGCPAIIDVDFEFSFKNTAILKFNQDLILNKYLFYYLISIQEENYKMLTRGANQPFLSLKVIKGFIIPFPPLEEQKAIVEKVETLMQKCNALEQEITQSEEHANMLMQAVLKEAFESKTENAEEYANA